MGIYKDCQEKIAGDGGKFYTRKLITKGLQVEPLTNKRMLRCACDRNSSAEVTDAIDSKDSDFAVLQKNNVHLAVGDKLQADAITVYFDSKRPLKWDMKEGMTGRHGASILEKKIRFVATITTPLQNALKQLAATKTLTENKEQKDES